MTITVAKDAGPALTRHVTLLRVKRASANSFTFTGWATTPAEDLVGDVVEPRGAVYELPLPLLWMHDHSQPVGVVESATVTERGIRVTFRLLPEVEKTKEAVALIEAGALALSIGFLPLDDEPLRTGGRRYTSWRWTELSIVSVAANPTAKIDRTIGKCLAAAIPKAQAPKEPQALPVYVPCTDLQEDFKRALATLPEAMRKQVSEMRSSRAANIWTLRDAHGGEIAKVSPQAKQADKPTKAAPSMKYITEKQMERFSEQLGTSLGGLIADQCLKPLRALAERIEALEQENKSLRSQVVRGGIRYKGYWKPGIYLEGDIVTEAGSAWIALRETREKPHHNATDWHLFVRKGKDA